MDVLDSQVQGVQRTKPVCFHHCGWLLLLQVLYWCGLSGELSVKIDRLDATAAWQLACQHSPLERIEGAVPSTCKNEDCFFPDRLDFCVDLTLQNEYSNIGAPI